MAMTIAELILHAFYWTDYSCAEAWLTSEFVCRGNFFIFAVAPWGGAQRREGGGYKISTRLTRFPLKPPPRDTSLSPPPQKKSTKMAETTLRTETIFSLATQSANHILAQLPEELKHPQVGIICGSGLGGLAGTLHPRSEAPQFEISYTQIPNFPHSTG